MSKKHYLIRKEQSNHKNRILYILLFSSWILTMGGFGYRYFSLPGGNALIHRISDIIVFLFLGCFTLYGYFNIFSFIIYLFISKRKIKGGTENDSI
ncbi:MAG: hypothetical protein Q8920_13385 [Bacillota bacterium]|nr:hypothetical protein [Bacillota bacterium]